MNSLPSETDSSGAISRKKFLLGTGAIAGANMTRSRRIVMTYADFSDSLHATFGSNGG